MTFDLAFAAMMQGEKWHCGGNGSDYWVIENGVLYHMSISGFGAGYSVPLHDDLMSDQWHPMKEEPHG